MKISQTWRVPRVALVALWTTVVLTLTGLILPTHANALDFSEGGLSYTSYEGEIPWRADDSPFVIVKGPTSQAQGAIVIPDTVTHDSATYTVVAIGDYAFQNNTRLTSVEFAGKMGGHIGRAAFAGCTSLRSVTFAPDCVLSWNFPSGAGAIRLEAFQGCTSLKTIEIPPLASAKSKGSENFDGYAGYWHNSYGPVAESSGEALDMRAFQGCTQLESVIFRAGNSEGALSYVAGQGGDQFARCTALKSLIFETNQQPYFMNPDGSVYNGGGFVNYWGYRTDAGLSIPDLYYSVDYYANEKQALADDAAANPFRTHGSRIARVAYLRGTSTADIAANRAQAYANGSEYAFSGYADGVAPNAAEAAVAGGLTTAERVSGQRWVWKLEGQLGSADELTESCYAYPALANDLSAGHVCADELTALRAEAPKHLELGFSIERWYGDDRINYQQGREKCWFAVKSDGDLTDVEVQAADGTVLQEGKDYTVSYLRYTSATSYTRATYFTFASPYLAVYEGKGDYSGTRLEQWMLIRPYEASVWQYTGATPADVLMDTLGTSPNFNSNAPYAVLADGTDPLFLLMAAGYAGIANGVLVPGEGEALVRSPYAVNVALGGTTAKRCLAFGISEGAAGMMSEGVSVRRVSYVGAYQSEPALAARAYEYFEDSRGDFGADDFAWGDTALVCPVDLPEDYLAPLITYAYNVKAPVFFAQLDGSVTSATVEACGSFAHTTVIASTNDEAGGIVRTLQSKTGKVVQSIVPNADDAFGISAYLAEEQLKSGAANAGRVAVVDARDPLMVCAALARTGSSNGTVLVANGSGDAKRACAWLREHRDSIARVDLISTNSDAFSSPSWDALEQVKQIWRGTPDTELTAGDTISTSGCTFIYQGGSNLQFASCYDYPPRVASGDSVRYGTSTYSAHGSDNALTGTWIHDVDTGTVLDTPLSAASESVSFTFVSADNMVAQPLDASRIGVTAPGQALVRVRATDAAGDYLACGTIQINASGPLGIVGMESNYTAAAGSDAFPLNAVSAANAKLSYSSSDKGVATVSAAGYVTPVSGGTATITITATASGYEDGVAKVKVTVMGASKKSNNLKVTVKTGKVAAKKLKKKARSLKGLITVKGANGAVSYAKVVKGSSKRLSVTKKGAVKVKKGTKKGTYKIKVKVSAAGNATHAPGSKTVTVKVKVK